MRRIGNRRNRIRPGVVRVSSNHDQIDVGVQSVVAPRAGPIEDHHIGLNGDVHVPSHGDGAGIGFGAEVILMMHIGFTSVDGDGGRHLGCLREK